MAVLSVAGLGAAADLEPMGTAYSAGIFRNISLPDVIASTTVWVDSFGAKLDLCRAGDVLVLEGVDAWNAAAKEKSFKLAVLFSVDFLNMEKEGVFEPCTVFKESTGIGSELVLLVHQDSGIDSLSDLADQDICFTQDRFFEISHMWIDTLLAEKGLLPKETFFRSVSKNSKAMGTVLPVFFKKSTACVVTHNSFELMQELNPQVGKKLTVLAHSPNYISSIICLRSDCDPVFAEKLRSALPNLDNDASGKQFLMTFRITEMVPYQPDDLQTLRSLVEKHDKLQE